MDTLLCIVKHLPTAQTWLFLLVPEMLIELWEEKGNFSAG